MPKGTASYLLIVFVFFASFVLPGQAQEGNSLGEMLNINCCLMGKNVIDGSLSFITGRVILNDSTAKFRYAFNGTLKARLFEEVYLSGTFFYYLNKNEFNVPWIADFYYSLKRFNWRPKTFSYGYENYTNNLYSDNLKELVKKASQGYFFVSYNHNAPKKLIDKISIRNSSNINLVYLVRYAPDFLDEYGVKGVSEGGFFKGKFTLGMSLKYVIWNNFFVGAGVYQYVDPIRTMVPWDPDFTYEFGYYDWRPFRFSVTYGNWIANRFPWNTKEMTNYGFLDGTLDVKFNYAW